MKTPLTLERLKELAEEREIAQRGRVRAFMHASYHYAKSLGFSPSEAQVLQRHSKETILRLAQERSLNEQRD